MTFKMTPAIAFLLVEGIGLTIGWFVEPWLYRWEMRRRHR